MDPFTIYLLVAGGSAVAKSFFNFGAAQEKNQAIELEAAQQQIQLQQKQLQTVDLIERTTARQQAELTQRGVSASSPSFKAIVEDTYNIGSKELKNLDITKRLLKQNAEIEHRNVQNTLFAQMFGTGVSAANTLASLKWGS